MQKNKSEAKLVPYILPDRRSVLVAADVCRYASWIDFQLADGRFVIAVIAPGVRA